MSSLLSTANQPKPATGSNNATDPCNWSHMKYEFRLLNDILEKAISVKAGSFDAVTHERFLMMTAIHFWVKINWSTILFEVLKEMVDRTTKRAKGFAAQICVLLKGDPEVTLGEATIFPPLKILSEKTVHTYVATNKTIDARGETEEPEVAKVAVVKRKTVSKKKSATTIAKNKRTTSGQTVPKDQDLAIVSVALDVMPIQTVDPISAMTAAHPPPPKQKSPNRKLKLTPDSDEDVVEKEYDMETVVVEQKRPTSVDDVDTIIEEVIAATEQMESDVLKSDSVEDLAMRTVVEEPVATKSDDIQIVVAECSPVATNEDVGPLSKVQESFVSPISEDESMTIEEHLTLIPDGVMLPSLTSAEPTKIKFSSTIEIRGVEDGDWYKKNLPSIIPTDKGKKSLEEPDTIQGHPAPTHIIFLKQPATRRVGSGSNSAGRWVAYIINRNRTVKQTGRSGLRVEPVDPVNRTVDHGPGTVRVRVKPGPWPGLAYAPAPHISHLYSKIPRAARLYAVFSQKIAHDIKLVQCPTKQFSSELYYTDQLAPDLIHAKPYTKITNSLHHNCSSPSAFTHADLTQQHNTASLISLLSSEHYVTPKAESSLCPNTKTGISSALTIRIRLHALTSTEHSAQLTVSRITHATMTQLTSQLSTHQLAQVAHLYNSS
ncbi:hypothetical protein F511_21178 [Dorcoceras hygrometricum]|uniref:Uncharacterized protein n=1 Tax=Dorcoceras hygrometricum TaxID=472368 RepID=A0A2Z7BY40_9LAMI|nr:hypothetical protein F511_21178 [Dorcoceras hygrometricum]